MSVFRVGSNKSSVNNFPSVRPTLDLDFANSKTLDPRITFTRASGGSYTGADGLIKYAGVNEARFDHDPVTGESLGLLVEESRTNLLLRSEEFDNVVWLKGSSSITANVTTAPDGTLTGDKLVENTNTSNHQITQNLTVVAGTTYSFSFYAKSGERSRIRVETVDPGIGNAVVVFDLSGDGSVVIAVGGFYVSGSAKITSVGNGWFRCSLSAIHSTTNGTFRAALIESGTTLSYTGDGTSGLFLWGAQVEVGAFPTSYIPTQGSTRTRAADSASITGKNFSEWYNPSEGTFFTNTRILGYNIDGFPRPFGFVKFADKFNDFWQVVYNGSSGTIFTETRVNGATPLSVSNLTLAANTNVKIANAVKNGEGQFTSFNGQSIVSNVSSSLSSAINSILFNYSNHNGHIAQLTYFPKRLPNAQLQALTK